MPLCETPGCEAEAVGHPVQPDWCGYAMCAECITEYESRPPDYHRDKYAEEGPTILAVYDAWSQAHPATT